MRYKIFKLITRKPFVFLRLFVCIGTHNTERFHLIRNILTMLRPDTEAMNECRSGRK